MKIKMLQPEMLKVIQLSSSVIERRSSVPILSNVSLKAEGKNLHTIVTDLEVFLEATVPCDVLEDGEVTVGAKQLHDILRELSSGQSVTITTQENHWVEITSGKARFQLMGLPSKDFPAVPSTDSVTLNEMKAETLLEMIDKTLFSVSNDETRYHLNGVYFTRTERSGSKTLRMVSTDGHRLCLIERGLDAEVLPLSKGVIIPRKGLTEIRKVLTEGTGPLLFGFDDNRAVLKRGGITLQVRLIDGEFPDYQRVIPKSNDKTLRLSRDHFLSSLKRISLLSNEMSKTVTFNIKPGILEIRSNNPNVGEAKEDIEIDYTGETMKIGFNARYFIDILSALNTNDVKLELRDQLSPGVVKSPTDDSYTAVVMPMRI